MKNVKKLVTEGGIMDILTAVFDGQIPQGKGSNIKRAVEQKERGVIRTFVARRLFEANRVLENHMTALEASHKKLHEANKFTPEDCISHRKKMCELKKRNELLDNLLHQAIAEEYPAVLANNVSICDGWTLVSEGEWNDVTPFQVESSICQNFFSRLQAVVTRKTVDTKMELDEVSGSETVIGYVDDPRICTLFSLGVEIDDEITSLRNRFSSNPNTLDNLKVSEAKALSLTASHYVTLSRLIASLCWRSVRESVPGAMTLPEIGVRKGWRVVERPVEEENEEVMFTMGPSGPALAIRIL